MSGQSKYRDLWEKYYNDINGIIYVVDSTDKIRMAVAKNELDQLLTHNDIKGKNVPILFFANKMDIPGAFAAKDCVDVLKLEQIADRSWHIQSTDAIQGLGIEDGLKWLMERLAGQK
jgi:ADP-ribosylation factor-like protein 6